MNTKHKSLVLLILWAAAFYPIYPALFKTYLNHSNNSHGLLVPLVALYFIWQKKDLLNLNDVTSSVWGAIILVFSLALYVLSFAGGIVFISRSMIVFSLIGLVLFTLGNTIFKIFAFPLFFLIFMVPVPDSILNLVAFPLQLFATNISAFLIKTLSIPVYQEGNMLYFTRTQLEVAEACSGIRSIMALTMLSVIFGYLSNGDWARKGIILASAIPIAIIANILRVSGTGILAHFFGARVARGFMYEFSGLAVFVFGFVLLFLVYSMLNRGIVKEKSA